MSDWILPMLLAVAGALAVLGATYRVTEVASWPAWLRPVGASAWYVLAAVAGAAAVLWATSDDDGPDDDAGGIGTADTEPIIQEPTSTEITETVDEVEDDVAGMTDEEVADALEEKLGN